MNKCILAAWQDDDGVLSFEWVLLVTVLVLGIVTGVSAARDAIIDELGDVSQAMVAVDQTYTVAFPLSVAVHTEESSAASDTSFVDAADYTDCARVPNPLGQGGETDVL